MPQKLTIAEQIESFPIDKQLEVKSIMAELSAHHPEWTEIQVFNMACFRIVFHMMMKLPSSFFMNAIWPAIQNQKQRIDPSP